MYGLSVEYIEIESSIKLVDDLVHHIMSRLHMGKVVIVSSDPKELLDAIKLRWQGLAGLNLRDIVFDSSSQVDDIKADVYLAEADLLLSTPPQCPTLYFTTEIDKRRQNLITSWMPKNSLVVIYEFAHS